jgi:hypothetical protein
MGTKSLVCLLDSFPTAQAFLFAQKAGSESLPLLISQFHSTRDLEAKERLLNVITTDFPGAGPTLLQLAQTTTDVDTRWMAIRGIGTLKYKRAMPFLVESLRQNIHISGRTPLAPWAT